VKSRTRYVKGDYNVISDRDGGKYKRSECRKEWNGLLVHRDEWEPRHPQDFVKGVKDDMSVPDPRPGAEDTHSVFETTLDAAEDSGQTTLSVTSTANMTNGYTILVHQDDDTIHISTISSFVAGDTVTIADALTHKSASGSTVVIQSPNTTGDDL
jgi:hypothetical protein